MNRFYVGAMAVAVGLLACQGDPTASLRGGPFLITATPDLMFIAEGDERSVVVSVEDEQLNPLALDVTATSANPSVFTVRSDPLPATNKARSAFIVTAVAPGQAALTLMGGGLSKTATVNVLPLAFGGAPSTTTPGVGQVYTLLATPTLKFGAETKVSFGTGECGPADDLVDCPIHGLITSQTADAITVIVPRPDDLAPAPLTVEDVVVSYVTGLKATLPTAATHTVENTYSDSDAPDPADPDANFTVTAGGAPIVFYDGYTSAVCDDGVGGDCDRFYTITLAGTTTFKVDLEWYTAADVDLLFCDVGCANFVGNFAGATGANPESSTVTLAAGTYNLYFNVWLDEEEPPHLFKVTITPQ